MSGLSHLQFRAVGDQPAFDAAALERFVAAPRIAVLAYVRAGGRPGQSPIWYEYRDGAFYMSTATGSPKANALARDPRVCLTIQDEAPPYRASIFDGEVELTPMAKDGPTASIATRYFGRIGGAEYAKMTDAQYDRTGLTLITLRPSSVRGFDNTRGLVLWQSLFLKLRATVPFVGRWL
jgi:PPOX class probable F420-dependent enzyme